MLPPAVVTKSPTANLVEASTPVTGIAVLAVTPEEVWDVPLTATPVRDRVLSGSLHEAFTHTGSSACPGRVHSPSDDRTWFSTHDIMAGYGADGVWKPKHRKPWPSDPLRMRYKSLSNLLNVHTASMPRTKLSAAASPSQSH